MTEKTFDWKPTSSIPDEVLINEDGTITLPIQLKPLIDRVDAMSDEEKLGLLSVRRPTTNETFNWDKDE